jgi:isoquinoline 1-oxidoreductase subunit alpha
MRLMLDLNGKNQEIDADADTPLLWVLRDHLGLTGTKYGCGMGLCGACTVHVGGAAARACVRPVSSLRGKRATTIEGLQGPVAVAIQQAWVEEDVTQCGYCQPGQIMAAAALLSRRNPPNHSEIDDAMSGNLCRCGTYPRIRRAIHRASAALRGGK